MLYQRKGCYTMNLIDKFLDDARFKKYHPNTIKSFEDLALYKSKLTKIMDKYEKKRYNLNAKYRDDLADEYKYIRSIMDRLNKLYDFDDLASIYKTNHELKIDELRDVKLAFDRRRLTEDFLTKDVINEEIICNSEKRYRLFRYSNVISSDHLFLFNYYDNFHIFVENKDILSEERFSELKKDYERVLTNLIYFYEDTIAEIEREYRLALSSLENDEFREILNLIENYRVDLEKAIHSRGISRK